MISLRTDFSPEAASEKQEIENMRMLDMLLVIAGFSTKDLVNYNKAAASAAEAYQKALDNGIKDEELGGYMPETWVAAKEAAQVHLNETKHLLIDAGITIENRLIKSDDDALFSHILTTIYNDFGPNPVAKIERYIIDKEAETYQSNITGHEAVIPHV